MYRTVKQILESSEFSVVEQFILPGQDATYAEVPKYLFQSKIGNYLNQGFPDGLWSHQAKALEELGAGNNVVTSTGTASGKSLIFRALAFHKVLLDPDCRVIVFYPLRALVEDQLRGWREMAKAIGLDESIVGRIDGTVTPLELRERVLENSRIVVMTPDVMQAWLMSRLAMPTVKSFVGNVSTLVMDEAHTLEGVFGSNFAFLIRRLLAARDHILSAKNSSRVQLVAATATISSPGEHMKSLTGHDFVSVDHNEDGAQSYERIVAHIASPEGLELEIAQQLQKKVIADSQEGEFITFVDSRKGVETLAMSTENSFFNDETNQMVSSYRAGYTTEDRRQIEHNLRTGKIRGVVSTSALELGIDFPSLTVGFNVGVPTTRKAYRQRLGRIGRNGPGVFVVIGSPNDFRQYGTTFEQYDAMSVEPSYLYLDNRFMQFAHGRCIAEEREALAAPAQLPASVRWPEGFEDLYAAAGPGGNRSREFDVIAQLGGDTPHYGYPLRNIGEPNFQIKTGENDDPMGEANLSQALRESYPGATYFHNMRPYYVVAWHTQSFSQPYIRVKQEQYGRSTQPRITTWINAGITTDEILDGHLLQSESGFLAECQMQITEKVEGYVDVKSGEFRSYRELQQRNPNMKTRSRNFRTSGVILCIQNDWFNSQSVKNSFVDKLREVFVREFSISPHDVGSAASYISVLDADGNRRRSGCITVFDQTYGSLRFTEKLYLDFDLILERLKTAIELDPTGNAPGMADILSRIVQVTSKFESARPFKFDYRAAPTGFELVFKPGSIVCYREQGYLAEEVTVLQASIVDGRLRYRVEAITPKGQPPLRRWLVADAIEPSADADSWELAWWNLQSEEFEEPNDDAK